MLVLAVFLPRASVLVPLLAPGRPLVLVLLLARDLARAVLLVPFLPRALGLVLFLGLFLGLFLVRAARKPALGLPLAKHQRGLKEVPLLLVLVVMHTSLL